MYTSNYKNNKHTQ
ncbi:hypothetical protein F383_25978 [Gossypium arboreum]|uniref:Uncharacterized protein n=1 Tax=Gossypium arboreum TaxID=29729 RepID=A0A0B0MJ88_GOSAR|nr:hypothetical protein F383_25978 [Gossypium arboreum]